MRRAISAVHVSLWLCLLTILSQSAFAQGCGREPASPPARPTQLTPVTLRILQGGLAAVPATDGMVHIAFAAQLTNLDHRSALLAELRPVDPSRGDAPTGESTVRDMDGRDITNEVLPFKPPPVDGIEPRKSVMTRELPGGASGISFFDVRYRTLDEVPAHLSIRLSLSFAGDPEQLAEHTDAVPVSCLPPVVLSPPLVGPRWWNANGCCEVISPHRGATLPVGGDIKPPEQFAIDYVQLTSGNGCCTGPAKDLASWPFFGAPILAVADGVVAVEMDGMAEQVPGDVKGVTAQNATGNSIIEDIGDGRYVLYAHIKTGTIPKEFAVGSRLTRGQQIGQVGNTGSSTAPHLHFQVMDRPSALNATGLPFVFDEQRVQGRVIGTANAVNDAYEAGEAVRFDTGAPATQLRRMPAEGQVVDFGVR